MKFRDDRKFLDIVERGTIKKYEHYVVPLPFLDQELVIPNNKQQAVKRLMGLKKRFIRVLSRLQEIHE